MGGLSPTHWALVVLAFVVLFGAKRLPDAARGIGQSLRIFKAEVRAGDGSDSKPADEPPAPGQVAAGPTTPQHGSAASQQSPDAAQPQRPSGH